MEKKTVGTIIVLFVVALLLGAIIFGQQGGQQPLVSEPDAITPPAGSSGEAPTRPKQGTSAQPNAVAVLAFPGQNSTKEEQQQHRDLVEKLAQKAAHLDITRCAPKPLVLYHTKGENLIVQNNDTGADYALIWGKTTVTVPAGKSVIVKGDTIGGPGDIGYGCYMAGVPNPSITTVGVIHSKEAGG